MLAFLTNVMPLITSFDRIIIEQPACLALMQNECSTMATPMLRSARILHIL
jgi:hypothetical protein